MKNETKLAEIKEALLPLFHRHQADNAKMTAGQLNDLFECGIINESGALRFIIKNEYWEMMKLSDISTRCAIMDLSIKWEVSETTIKNIIYKTPVIKS